MYHDQRNGSVHGIDRALFLAQVLLLLLLLLFCQLRHYYLGFAILKRKQKKEQQQASKGREREGTRRGGSAKRATQQSTRTARGSLTKRKVDIFIPACINYSSLLLLSSVFIIQHNPTELVSITHDRSTVSHKNNTTLATFTFI